MGSCARRIPVLPVRAAPLLALRPRHRVGRPADVRALRDGCHRLEPARRRLAHRPLPEGPRSRHDDGPSLAPARTLRPGHRSEPGQDGPDRPAGRGGCRMRHLSPTSLSPSSSPTPPSPRPSSDQGRWSSSTISSPESIPSSTMQPSIGSIRSCLPAAISTPPTPGGSHLPFHSLGGGGGPHPCGPLEGELGAPPSHGTTPSTSKPPSARRRWCRISSSEPRLVLAGW